jgi:hypothetical protein
VLEDRYSKYVKNREPRTSVLYSKDISSIARVDESNLITNKRDYLLQEYLQESLQAQPEKSKQRQEKENGLTYDKLRELLWA